MASTHIVLPEEAQVPQTATPRQQPPQPQHQAAHVVVHRRHHLCLQHSQQLLSPGLFASTKPPVCGGVGWGVGVRVCVCVCV